MNIQKYATPVLAALALALLGSRLAHTQDAPPPPPFNAQSYTLEAKYAVNDLLKYKMAMTMKMDMKAAKAGAPVPPLGEMSTNATIRMKTVAVKPDGTGVIVSQILEGETAAMGKKQSLAGTPPFTQEIDKRGRIKVISGLPTTGAGAQFLQGMDFKNMQSSGVLLPDHPVKVGDSWEGEVPFPIGNSKAKITCTLLGAEPVQGVETLKVKQLLVVPIIMSLGMDGQPTKDEGATMITMNGQVTVDGIMNILPANARLVKSSGDFGMKLAMEFKGPLAAQSQVGAGMEMTGNGKVGMTLLSAGKVEPVSTKPPAAPTTKPAAKRPAVKGK